MTALVTCLSIKTRPKQNRSDLGIRNTRPELKNSVTHWCTLKTNTFLREVTALRIVVGLARTVRRQIGNTVLGGCNSRPLEKNYYLESFVCLVQHQAEKTFSLKSQAQLLYCDQLKVHTHTFFIEIFLVCYFWILNQHKLCLVG